jgi:hypothetical protein
MSVINIPRQDYIRDGNERYFIRALTFVAKCQDYRVLNVSNKF